MKHTALLAIALFAFASCKKDPKETPETPDNTTAEAPKTLAFETKTYNKKSTIPCNGTYTYVTIEIPEANGPKKAADSINKGVFNAVREIVHSGIDPVSAKTYEEAMASFISNYDDYKKKYSDDDMAWERKVKGTIDYQSGSLLGIKINFYMFDGGAHGTAGNISLLFDPQTGKKLKRSDIFKDEKAFTAFAEKKFREKYKIPAGKSINSTGLLFTDGYFTLPEALFFREKGLLLSYNTGETGITADGPQEVFISYDEAKPYLKIQP